MDRASTVERVLAALRRRGIASARELGATLNLSQPGVSRALGRAGAQVARIGHARRTRYAAVREIRGFGARWPLYRIDERGQAHGFGQLTTLHRAGCLVTPDTPPDWLRREFIDGLFPGVPWFLDDMRPQGFLGSRFVHRFADELGLPDDLWRWDEDAVLLALLLHGEDGPGNFVLGDRALQRALGTEPEVIATEARAERFAELVQATLAGQRVGSSAAGEQPKFTACVADAGATCRHVIVKFSEPLDRHPGARRWADLLACEHLAAELLTARGHAAAATELILSHGRLCLESSRFDRVGAYGRRSVVTLAAWSDACDGIRDDWAGAAARMFHAGWIGANTLDQVRLRWWFGRLIGNSDMHFGNLVFFLRDALPLTLAPAYDMLPMRYRPTAGGVMYTEPLVPPPPLPHEQTTWRAAARLAHDYWERAVELDQLSTNFRRLAAANATAIATAQRRF